MYIYGLSSLLKFPTVVGIARMAILSGGAFLTALGKGCDADIIIKWYDTDLCLVEICSQL